MVEPVKPFACALPDCGMTFTNEDHLHVHTKKHDMVLQLGMEQKAAFVADQTPTPTRFIRNCEEVGLFQDLQNVSANPFDEGFKRAMETKQSLSSLETNDDVLHTPLVFPLIDGDSTLYTNNQRNIMITRSSSDESGTKEFESRTISKLTNEVRTISKIVNTQTDDVTVKHTDIQKGEIVCYKNNVTKTQSNVLRKDNNMPQVVVYPAYNASAKNEDGNIKYDEIDSTKLNIKPIMSQKSIDLVVDSLTSDLEQIDDKTPTEKTRKLQHFKIQRNLERNPELKVRKITNNKLKSNLAFKMVKQTLMKPNQIQQEIKKCDTKTGEFEVLVRLPNGREVKMKPVEEIPNTDTKEVLRKKIVRKVWKVPIPPLRSSPVKLNVKNEPNPISNVVPSGTLIPVRLVNQQGRPLSKDDLNKVPMTKLNNVGVLTNANKICNRQEQVTHRIIPITTSSIVVNDAAMVQKASAETNCFTQEDIAEKILENEKNCVSNTVDDDCVIEDEAQCPEVTKRTKMDLESRCAASKRYRERVKIAMNKQSEENRRLREANLKLIAEKAVLRLIITEHMKHCSNSTDLCTRLGVLKNCEL